MWLWSLSPRFALWTLWPPAGFTGGGPFSLHLPRSWAVLCSAPLQRVVRAHFLIFAGFFAVGIFPAYVLIRLHFMWAGGGGNSTGYSPSVLISESCHSPMLSIWPKEKGTVTDAYFIRSCSVPHGIYHYARTLHGCAPCRPGQVGEELSI